MQIIEKTYKWKNGLTKRNRTDYIILHHMAGNGSADDIHRIHLGNGWTGIGYHFYVRKDGSIYRGRPIDTVGAQCSNYNSISIGVCFEGNYETESVMPDAQKKAGQEIVAYLKEMYPSAYVKQHKNFNSTACPGKNFPFDEINNGAPKVTPVPQELTSVNDIVWELNHRGIITDIDLWLNKLKEDINAYWLARKCANMTVNK